MSFNSRSITIKLDSVTKFDMLDRPRYDARRTELKHDALLALLLNGNAIRDKYNLDYYELEKAKDEIDYIISSYMQSLKNNLK